MSHQKDFSSDRHRPTYHFLPPSNWMNDPNGLIQWKGIYHLFYQYNPNGPFWGTMHWGHAMSEDLMHWTHMPVALAPSPDGPDADGCFSGVVVDVNGVPTLIYTGVRGDDQLPCIATSRDDDLSSWVKQPDNPVITAPPAELETTIFRDHSVWKENGVWYQVIGSGIKGVGGTALVYRSHDFLSWQYVDSLVPLSRVTEGVARDATGWECPDFFAIDGRHVLTASMWDHRPLCVAYFVGDYGDQRFHPSTDGVVDSGECFYAPQSFTDEAGRRIMFGWLRESRSDSEQFEAGWSGVMSLPRVMSVLGDGSLGSAPAPEIKNLRGEHLQFQGARIAPRQALPLGDIPRDALELLLTLDSGATGTVGVEVLCSKDGRETTSIAYDVGSSTLTVDTQMSSHSENTEGGVYRVQHAGVEGTPVQLHVFVDHSVIEVFLNDEKCISARAYPHTADPIETKLIASDNSRAFESIDAWEMRSSAITGS
jgi:beta-fructofuranosidase